MNVRVFAAAALVAALAVVAVGASGASGGSAANTLTVWLQVRRAVRLAGSRGCSQRSVQGPEPGLERGCPVPDSGRTHLAKFDATLAGGNAPDVIEMGNTEMTKYMAAGAFQDISGLSFPNQSTWLAGPRSVGPLWREALRRSVLRRVACRHLPHRHLVKQMGCEDPDEPGRVHRACQEDRREEQRRRRSRPSTSPAPTGTSR